ncbi:hypothetical protein [Streptomyces sp. CBMA152]|uniref:hypothetical protein n=1 Tax=Streptomyces sp. CBMA152 TaxID=1896312 RepID=UPI0016607763|nr:hypothetical protein [Streptomyces sp. CBMA152]MBD0743100.1 hypothetical protein [Streptomyces sp. CBMA152]
MHQNRRTMAVASAGLLAAVALTACSSNESTSNNTDKASDKPSSAPTGTSKDLAGMWLPADGNKEWALLFTSQRTTTLTGRHFCTGPFAEEAGATVLKLTCADGETAYTAGTVKRTGDKIEVSWAGGERQEYVRAPRAKATGLPTTMPTP